DPVPRPGTLRRLAEPRFPPGRPAPGDDHPGPGGRSVGRGRRAEGVHPGRTRGVRQVASRPEPRRPLVRGRSHHLGRRRLGRGAPPAPVRPAGGTRPNRAPDLGPGRFTAGGRDEGRPRHPLGPTSDPGPTGGTRPGLVGNRLLVNVYPRWNETKKKTVLRTS